MLRVQVSPKAALIGKAAAISHAMPARSRAKKTSAPTTNSTIINSPLSVIQWPMNPVMRASTYDRVEVLMGDFRSAVFFVKLLHRPQRRKRRRQRPPNHQSSESPARFERRVVTRNSIR